MTVVARRSDTWQPALFDLRRPSAIEDAAVGYIRALDSCEQADSARHTEAATQVTEALHELAHAVRGHCTMCDAGTCPLDKET